MDRRKIILPPFDSSWIDESNDIIFVEIQSLDPEIFVKSYFNNYVTHNYLRNYVSYQVLRFFDTFLANQLPGHV